MIPRSVATHDGPFHADEVTACALLIVHGLVDRDKIVRTRDLKQMAQCEFVCDVGGLYRPEQKEFDHHQAGYQGPLSSAGMVWQYLYDQEIITPEEFTFLNEALVWGVDAHDNGLSLAPRGICTLSHIVSKFAPVSFDAPNEAFEKGFQEALDFVLGHIQRVWAHRKHALLYRDVVREVMEQSTDCLVFDRRLPWVENFFSLGGIEHPATFVIMPTGGGWKLRGIPPDPENQMGVRIPHPYEWAGLMGEELEAASGISGAVFCHKGRFISVWSTKEAAEQALAYILERER